jgi:hypothetical protein
LIHIVRIEFERVENWQNNKKLYKLFLLNCEPLTDLSQIPFLQIFEQNTSE